MENNPSRFIIVIISPGCDVPAVLTASTLETARVFTGGASGEKSFIYKGAVVPELIEIRETV